MQNANSATVAPDTAQGAARARPGGSVPRRAGAVHDADRALRRHPAARHHVRRARRYVLRPRPHAPHLRPQAGGAARGGAPQQLRGARARAAAGRLASELRHDGSRSCWTTGCGAAASRRWPRWPRSAGSTGRCPSSVRTSSTASRRPTASSTSSRTGRRSGRATRACRPSPTGRADYEQSDAEHPYKLVCPPARNFLNSTFSRDADLDRQGGRPASCACTPTRPRSWA